MTAALAGKSERSNPYNPSTEAGRLWLRGWNFARARMAARLEAAAAELGT